MQGEVPRATGATVGVSATLVRAVTDVVLPVLPVLRWATPVDDALRLGRRGLSDPFTPGPTGLPDDLPGVLYPVLTGLELAPPAELLAHDVLVGLDRDAVERVVAGYRTDRRCRESGGPDPLDGPRGLVRALIDALATDPAVTAVVVGPDGPDGSDDEDPEPALAARRGATLLGVGLAVATLVQRAVPGLGTAPDLADLLGRAGFARAVALLDRLPAPPGYDAAVWATHRRSYTLPRSATAELTSSRAHVTLAEGFPAAVRAGRPALLALLEPDVPDFSANGLVTTTGGALRIRIREPGGRCTVTVAVRSTAPDRVDVAGWDEVVETTWTATEGLAVLISGPSPTRGFVPVQTPPWPGTYRVRVHAVRPATRRGEPGPERYLVVVWAAPAAPDVAHKLTDDLGRRLRGEPEPRRPELRRLEGPVSGRDIEDGSDAAAITVVTGAPRVEDVVASFGADPTAPVPGTRVDDADLYSLLIMARPVGDVVLVVEPNGFRTLSERVLEPLSAGGRRVATWFWNVNGMTQLLLAEDGVCLAAFEPGIDPVPDDPAVAHLWADLDFGDVGRHTDQVLAVIEEFTGFRWQYGDMGHVLDGERAWVAPPA